MSRGPCTIWVGVQIIGTEDKLQPIGGVALPLYWYEDDNITYEDIKKNVLDLGFGEVSRISYYKPRRNSEYLTLVSNESEVRKMFEEAVEFGYAEIYIECKDVQPDVVIDKSVDRDDNPNSQPAVSYSGSKQFSTYTSVAEHMRLFDVAVDASAGEVGIGNINYMPEVEIEIHDSDGGGNNSDEEYAIARQNNLVFTNQTFDAIHGLGLDKFLHLSIGGGEMEHDYETTRKNQLFPEASNAENDSHKPVYQSEYEETDDDILSIESSDEDDLELRPRIKKKDLFYNPKCNHAELQLFAGMLFDNRKQFQEAIRLWAIWNGHDISWKRAEARRMEAICVDGCEWRMSAGKKGSGKTFEIRIIENSHTCSRSRTNKQATAEWLAKEFLQRFRRNPNYEPAHMIFDIKEKYLGLEVSIHLCYRARKIGMQILRGSLESHYAKLRAYHAELKRVDKEGYFEFFTINDPVTGAIQFQRYYVGFSGLRRGFREGCRPILCLDGCFLKTIVVGALLSAIGRDANNQMYPVAWAVVETENQETWTWFLQILFDDLRIADGVRLTLVSDQQKGLGNAIRSLAPHVEHRNCARHIFANWKKNHKDPELKRLFWRAVYATNESEFKKQTAAIQAESGSAYEAFMRQDPLVFCKAFIRSFPKCDAITSNMAETFNGYICKARQLPIIDMLEEIRTALMERMYHKYTIMEAHHEDICPRIRKIIEDNKLASRFCIATPAKGRSFQVTCKELGFTVSLEGKTCSCGAWELSGIPCPHALACIHFMKEDVVKYVDDYYKKNSYLKAYEYALQPINGKSMWPIALGIPMLPPPYRKMPGRPKKNRKKAIDEERKKPNVLRRHGMAMTCTHCLQEGHNKRGCPNRQNKPADRPPKLNRGRPRKEPNSQPTPKKSAKKQPVASQEATISQRATSSQPASTSQPAFTSQPVFNSQQAAISQPSVNAVGTRISTESGNVYIRPPVQTGFQYVTGSRDTAAAAREKKRNVATPPSNLSKRHAGLLQISQPKSFSQSSQVSSSSPAQADSVIYKSTATQPAAPKTSKLAIRRPK